MMDDDQRGGGDQEGGGSRPSSPMRLTDVVKDIMGKVVAKQSSMNYACQNTHFALFCYESEELRSTLLVSWFVEWLQEFDVHSARKKYVMNCFLTMSPEDDNCPFLLSNLTFAHYSNFLSTRTRTRGKKKGESNFF